MGSELNLGSHVLGLSPDWPGAVHCVFGHLTRI